MKTPNRHPHTSGQAMLIAVVFFLAISTTIVIGIATPILKQVQNSRELIRSKQTFFAAEGAIEDTLYKLKNNKRVSTGDTVTANGITSTITITDEYDAKVVTARAANGSLIRAMETAVIAGIGTSFNYGVQTGNGGFILGNSSGVNGNVYANGDILGSNESYIVGTAIAANSAALSADQTNGTLSIPPSAILFRDTSGTEDIAQKFYTSTSSPVNNVAFYIKKIGSPGNANVRIVTDNSGSPGSVVVDSATLSASTVTTSFGWVTATFSANHGLTAGTPYWIVIDNGGTYSATNYYTIGADSGYASGTAKIGRYSTSAWNATTPADLDIYFKLYLGGISATIDNVLIGSGTTGDARAHSVTNSRVHGLLYCQTGSGNNKPCDTSLPDPSPVGYPISDANIEQWKTDAEAGGVINGNYTVNGSQSLGPKKIVGNLTVNGTLTLTGTLWVTGTISGSNGSTVKLVSSYGVTSGVIVADGPIDLSNNMQFQGVANQPDTYILLLTTSACPQSSPCASNNSAIYLGNNAGAVILNAQKGKLYLKNGSGVSEAVAYQIQLEPNATVIYNSGLANQNFTSGPSGSWNIIRWQEVE